MTETKAVAGTLVGAGAARLRTLRWEVSDARGRVVLAHGLGEHAGLYRHVAEALGLRGYSVMAYDQRGHGASEGRRGHVEDFDLFVEDLHRVRSEAELRLHGPGAPLLVGHSMGGLVVLRYLQTYRPSTPGAVLSAPWLALARPVPRWKRALAGVLLRLAPGLPVREPLPPEDLTRDEAMVRAREADPLVHSLVTAGLLDEVEKAQARALQGGIEPSISALLLVPGEDRVADSARTLAWAATLGGDNVETVRLDERRHEPFNDLGREEVFTLVADWFDARHKGPRSGEPPGSERVPPRPEAPT